MDFSTGFCIMSNYANHITVLANLDSLEMQKNALVKEIISSLIIFNGENSFSKLDVYAKYFL